MENNSKMNTKILIRFINTMDLEHIPPSCSPWGNFDHAEVHRKLKKVMSLLCLTKNSLCAYNEIFLIFANMYDFD